MTPQKGEKKRLDVLMVDRGLAQSREQAQRLILAGEVSVGGRRDVKPGQRVAGDAGIEVRATEKYVSRGGLKLERALECFGIPVKGRTCADIGTSTGGFTDCMLQNGAARVFAVDVGKSQIHSRLRNDPRVILIEEMNARNLSPGSLPEPPEFLAVDVSFISLLLVLGPLSQIAAPGAECAVLVKPQFEATREEVSKGRGIITSPEIHARVLRKVVEAAPGLGWWPVAAIPSPIEGGSGNREFLIHLRKSTGPAQTGTGIDIDAVVGHD
ncbi:MAG: TlyA family RNA methyltransferase [Candidatus Sumerlaeaceae bacterium]|nr:TlyA family RNA methyltransferase [Candidatus Sumerlaeaceae bacterium]